MDAESGGAGTEEFAAATAPPPPPSATTGKPGTSTYAQAVVQKAPTLADAMSCESGKPSLLGSVLHSS